MRPVVRDKTVLELAAGTGLIAKHIANAAEYIEVTDASERDDRGRPSGIIMLSKTCIFRCRICSACRMRTRSFDVVIVSNALHIVPQPEKSLVERSNGC